MKSYFFSEQSYYPCWEQVPGNPRITCPSAPVDVNVAHRLLHEYIQQCVLADRLGLNIMVNEHHASYTCMSVSCFLTLGILATHTKNARLLALGVPIINRDDPFRVAEEAALVDVLSGGRLELGLIKGTAYEAFISNSNHAYGMKRFWEAHDLILKALSHRDGSFSWEGDNFHYRHVNLIPPPFQQPHPPIWMTTLSGGNAKQVAQHGYVISIPGSAPGARRAFPIYREEYERVHGRKAPLDRLAYLAHMAIARDEATAIERGRKLLQFTRVSERLDVRFANPPGTLSNEDNARVLRAGKFATHRPKALPDGTPLSNPPTVREQILTELLFCGTPDQVYAQLERFYESCGGFGNLLVQMGGENLHEEIVDSLTLFANEVQPRLENLTARTSGLGGHEPGPLPKRVQPTAGLALG